MSYADEFPPTHPADEYKRMELRYCPRCGALGIRPAGEENPHCRACARILDRILRRGNHAASDL